MKYGIIFVISILLASCSGKTNEQTKRNIKEVATTESCKESVRSYEFGRYLYGISSSNQVLNGSKLSVSKARETVAESLGVAYEFFPDNECVRVGFKDAEMGTESPYNKDYEKGWMDFEDGVNEETLTSQADESVIKNNMDSVAYVVTTIEENPNIDNQVILATEILLKLKDIASVKNADMGHPSYGEDVVLSRRPNEGTAFMGSQVIYEFEALDKQEYYIYATYASKTKRPVTVCINDDCTLLRNVLSESTGDWFNFKEYILSDSPIRLRQNNRIKILTNENEDLPHIKEIRLMPISE